MKCWVPLRNFALKCATFLIMANSQKRFKPKPKSRVILKKLNNLANLVTISVNKMNCSTNI